MRKFIASAAAALALGGVAAIPAVASANSIPTNAPACVAPGVLGQSLATVRHELKANHCTPGPVIWVPRSLIPNPSPMLAHFPHRRIVYVASRSSVTHPWLPGSRHPYGTTVAIVGLT